MLPPITIHKALSCPPDFTSNFPQTPSTTSSTSNAPRRSSDTKRRNVVQQQPYSGNFVGYGTPLTMPVNHRTHGAQTPVSAQNGISVTDSTTPASAAKAVPGRPRRRGNRTPLSMPKSKKDPNQSLRYRLLNARWMKNPMKDHENTFTSLVVAVMLWYSLGVISITTSKLLMMAPRENVGGVPPLFLTMQQLLIGTTMLRFLLHIGFMGSRGIQPWPSPSAAAQAAAEKRRRNLLFNNNKNENNNTIFR